VEDTRPYCLTIAGYDPTAGAGVLADTKTFEMNGVYGMAIVTANTLQTDDQFINVQWIEIDIILNQLRVLLEKYDFRIIKIGLVENTESLSSIIKLAKLLKPNVQIIWDPILKSSSGFNFHAKNELSLQFFEENCTLITPNWEEFTALWGEDLELLKQKEIRTSILIKGGHRTDKTGCDLLFENAKFTEIEGASFHGKSKHGTGCVLSAAIAANLTKGENILESCKSGKKYVEKFILSNETNLGYHHVKI
jgi:hydroxymethylpyrimidine/phosphomethylpyrimidine kinase